MEIIDGVVESYDEHGTVYIQANYPDVQRFVKKRYGEVQILLKDGRQISVAQRKKAHALINEIADFMGEYPEPAKKLLKVKFKSEILKGTYKGLFSLSDCDMTLASEFIDYLVDFVLLWDIPTKQPLIELCDDVARYVYACALHKKCAVCGKKAELHHIDKVGMGRDRHDVCHKGMEAMSLCREHHTEIHTAGDEVFLDKYHLGRGVELDDALCQKWRLKRREA